jgi:N-acetylglucosamine-6-phosphate deacetylase
VVRASILWVCCEKNNCAMKRIGRDAIHGEKIAVEFGEDRDAVIQHVDPFLPSNHVRNISIDSGVQDDDWIASGFIDLQVNGFAGADFNDSSTSHGDIDRAMRAIFSTGVTRFFPTVITGAPENMCGALSNLAAARESLEYGRAMEAFHVEGPYISPEDGPRGAHPKEWVRKPDLDEFRRMQDAAQGNIRMVTLAPEWPGALALIEQLSRQGVVASIGHTRATPEQIRDAVSAGARMSTHLGNAGAPSVPRRNNYLFAQLSDDRLAASFIVDGHHLADSFLKIALRAKGVERSVLVTDAAMPASCKPGRYTVGEVEVELHDDGRVTLLSGRDLGKDNPGNPRLAGSALRMDHAISNVMRIADLSIAQAVTMATTNPARVGRIPGRLRGIQPGERADLVRFRMAGRKLEVLETWFGGRRVYAA